MENPLPTMPQRMRSNKTFQPQSQKFGDNQQAKVNFEAGQDENSSEVNKKDKISQLAIDYRMHMQNKNRIQSLVHLLG